MARITCDFFSHALGKGTSMTVLLPNPGNFPDGREPAKPPYSVLWLLHGLTDDHTSWSRRSALERYVSASNMAVVMPDGARSFYQNMASGPRYADFISEELPAYARSFFPLSDQREDNFIAGLSMGGFGAFYHALHHPEKYCAAASLSGVLGPAERLVKPILNGEEGPISEQELRMIFGQLDDFDAHPANLMKLIEKKITPMPKLYACCGTDDFLYEHNVAFNQKCQQLGIPLTYEEGQGAHTWEYWDKWIQRVLQWINEVTSA